MVAEIVYGVVLGVVQGIAEFLPISSKGHLILIQQPLERWLGFTLTDRDRLEFDVVLHFGTLISLLIIYRWDLVRLPLRLWAAIVIGTIPVGVIGLLFHDKIETFFGSPLLTGFGLLGTATLLVIAQTVERRQFSMNDMSLSRAAGIGFFQAAAVLPGLSRSGTTIAGGCVLGFDRDTAARFSFFLAIPAIVGACVVTAAKFAHDPVLNNSLVALVTGAFVSFIVGFISLQWLLRMIAKGRLHWFAWYCAAVGLLTIAWQCALRSGVLPA